GCTERSWSQRPRSWPLILPPLGNLWWQSSLMPGIKPFDPAVRWRTGTVSFGPSLLSIAASPLICWPSWLSGTTIGSPHVGCTKDSAHSYAPPWSNSPPTGFSLYAILLLFPPAVDHHPRSSLLPSARRSSDPTI